MSPTSLSPFSMVGIGLAWPNKTLLASLFITLIGYCGIRGILWDKNVFKISISSIIFSSNWTKDRHHDNNLIQVINSERKTINNKVEMNFRFLSGFYLVYTASCIKGDVFFYFALERDPIFLNLKTVHQNTEIST